MSDFKVQYLKLRITFFLVMNSNYRQKCWLFLRSISGTFFLSYIVNFLLNDENLKIAPMDDCKILTVILNKFQELAAKFNQTQTKKKRVTHAMYLGIIYDNKSADEKGQTLNKSIYSFLLKHQNNNSLLSMYSHVFSWKPFFICNTNELAIQVSRHAA